MNLILTPLVGYLGRSFYNRTDAKMGRRTATSRLIRALPMGCTNIRGRRLVRLSRVHLGTPLGSIIEAGRRMTTQIPRRLLANRRWRSMSLWVVEVSTLPNQEVSMREVT